MKKALKKALQQSDFKLTIVKDLGMINNRRHATFKCPKCNEDFSSRVDNIKSGNTSRCIKCQKFKRFPDHLKKLGSAIL